MIHFSPQQTVMLLMLCCGGYRGAEIAKLLKISQHAVRQTFRLIYDKTGMSSQTELIAWFYRKAL